MQPRVIRRLLLEQPRQDHPVAPNRRLIELDARVQDLLSYHMVGVGLRYPGGNHFPLI